MLKSTKNLHTKNNNSNSSDDKNSSKNSNGNNDNDNNVYKDSNIDSSIKDEVEEESNCNNISLSSKCLVDQLPNTLSVSFKGTFLCTDTCMYVYE